MNKVLRCLLAVTLAACVTKVSATNNHLRMPPPQCNPEWLTQHMEHVLPCYLQEKESVYSWDLTSEQPSTIDHDGQQIKVTDTSVSMNSLKLQHKGQTIDHPIWQHRMSIYQPENLEHNTALLVISGGIINPMQNSDKKTSDKDIDFARLAARTKSVVINLRDIPNQYLQIQGMPLKEDSLVAYTWSMFLRNPGKNYNWPLQLPMVKAVVSSMNTAQEIMKQRNVSIEKFVLTGASKRGWTASLTASQDERVVAVIPQVADFMNLKEMINHIFNVYPEGNPALAPYLPLKAMFEMPEMAQLTSIIDPYSYKRLLELPKFMVTASGDHFVPPDTSKVFFEDLPGKKWMRVLPNQGHYITRKSASLVMDLTESFYGAFVQGRTLPEISWSLQNGLIEVKTSLAPKSASLWQANNTKSRDFRKLQTTTDLSDYTRTKVNFISNEDGSYVADVKIPEQLKGWTASFVEMRFDNAPFSDLVFTTRVFVTPDSFQ